MKKSVQLIAWFIGLMSPAVFAQSPDSKNDASTPKTEAQILSNDPIVAMLDSLVKLNSRIRYNSINTAIPNSKLAASEIPAYTSEDLRNRLKKIASPISLDYNEQVKAYIDLYAVRKRELTATIIGLSQLYFPLFEQMLDQQGLPLEFKYLAVIESALNPLAVSKCGATGLWQFMYETGRQYKLDINSYVDERKDPHASTMAACQYFKNMYSIYHDWLLVIAAYNCGPGNVNRAIARSGGKKSFWEISKYLPQETRGYVPAFIAVNYVLHYSNEHNITPVQPAMSFFEVDTVLINHTLSFDQISSFIDVPVPVLQYLNPSYKKNIIPYTTQAQKLRLPANKASVFAANSNLIYKKVIEQEMMALTPVTPNINEANALFDFVTKETRIVHIVKRKENMIAIARMNKCSLAEIKEWNHLKNNKVHNGQKLILYATVTQKIQRKTDTTKSEMDVSDKTCSIDSISMAVNSVPLDDSTVKHQNTSRNTKGIHPKTIKYVYHTIQRGDTLWNIAQRYHNSSIEKIREINNSRDLKRLLPGTKIKVAIVS
jgi:membrane-bound lytic murein transglycosylase D